MRDLHKKTKAEPGNTSAFTRCWERRVHKGDQKEKKNREGEGDLFEEIKAEKSP